MTTRQTTGSGGPIYSSFPSQRRIEENKNEDSNEATVSRISRKETNQDDHILCIDEMGSYCFESDTDNSPKSTYRSINSPDMQIVVSSATHTHTPSRKEVTSTVGSFKWSMKMPAS